MQRLNTILRDVSKSETEYKIAEIYSEFNTTNPRLTNVNMSLSDFNIDPHPNALGHEIISLKILEKLNEDSSTEERKDISQFSITTIEDQHYTGNSIEPKITIKDGNTKLVENEDYILTYFNNINIGEATVIITGIGNYMGKTTKTFNIKNTDRKDISSCSVQPINYLVYTGMNIEPEIIIKDGDTVLQKNKDYTLKYNNNLNVGKATITITGIGNYKGTITSNFNIIAKSINDTITVEDVPDQLYIGKEIKPDVIVSYNLIRLVEGKDYKLKYKNNVELGTATVEINGIGNYTGTLIKEFNIVTEISPEPNDISQFKTSEIPDKVYTGKLITPEVTLESENGTLLRGTDYKIIYSNNMSVGTGVATIIGIGNYTGTIEKTFNITQKDIKNLSVDDIVNQVYTGKSIEPEIVITDDVQKLTPDTDYTIEYLNNVEIGTATIKIEAIGNYKGTITKTFNIVAPSAKDDVESNNTENSTETLKDDTTAFNKILPFAGKDLIIAIIIISFSIISIVSYILYKKIE